MNFYSYVVYNLEHDRFYYGFTADYRKVEQAHDAGKIDLTKEIRPWKLIFYEGFEAKLQAIKRSHFYRSEAGQRFLRKKLNF